MNSKLTGLPHLEGCTQLLPSFALLLCAQLLAAAPTHAVGASAAPARSGGADPIYLVIRSDDGGMSHSVNVALEKLIDTGLPVSQYEARPQDKTDSLIALTNRLKPGFTVLVTHVGIDKGELDAVTSPRFRDALKAREIHLLTYRQLIAVQGLKSMRRPKG